MISLREDTVAPRMPVDRRTIQPHGRLHGGASVVLAETIGSFAAKLVIDPKESICVGLEINANHIRPGTSGREIITVRPEALGRMT
jgi:1,4-dihydroxy-2-naphthoyl-CoA hydrolase